MKEEEIRPRQIFQEYLRLAEQDAETYFGSAVRHAVACPACQSLGSFIFKKHGFDYEECPHCLTIFVSPRPSADSFFRYYQESPSSIFFATSFHQATAESRRAKLWRPKVLFIDEVLKKHNASSHAIIDIGGGCGTFAEEYLQLLGQPVVLIEPSPEAARVSRDKGLAVIESFLEHVSTEQLPDGPRAFVSFELFEHLHDTEIFLTQLRKLMRAGDLFLFTTLSGIGLDIQTLWEDSNSISLQHLNFFNPKSVRFLLQKKQLEVITVETPGQLDIDIIFNNQTKIKDRFWRNVISTATEEERQVWQTIIAKQGLSSHMFVVSKAIS
jgi:hypothetical protein